MSRMSDAEYELMKDCRDKKITARSARHTRTHCGKSGPVKLPSDYLTKKEKEKLNGECKSYRMNDPMNWVEFKSMPEDLQICYVKALRKKYNVPDNALCEMFGVSSSTVNLYFEKLGLGLGRNGRARTWDEVGFVRWSRGGADVDIPKTAEESKNKTVAELAESLKDAGKAAESAGESLEKFANAIPTNGTLVFEGTADTILRTMNDILKNRYVRMTVQWSTTNEPAQDTASTDVNSLKKVATTIDYAIINEQRKQALGTKG